MDQPAVYVCVFPLSLYQACCWTQIYSDVSACQDFLHEVYRLPYNLQLNTNEKSDDVVKNSFWIPKYQGKTKTGVSQGLQARAPREG